MGDKALQVHTQTPSNPNLSGILPDPHALLQQALEPVLTDLSELNGRLLEYLPTETSRCRAVLSHILESGGKRIRPALFFLSCRVLNYRGEHYFPIGAVTEFVHTASLLHDDVIDHARLRRGKPTANSLFGDTTGVLVGDLIYATASALMAATGSTELGGAFAFAIQHMSSGELLQIESLFNPQLSEQTYFRIVKCKTAMLVGACCQAAAIITRSHDKTKQALHRFGHDVGMAFQLIDDALDYGTNANQLGKETLADLREGKVTLPIILLRKRLSPEQVKEVDEIICHHYADKTAIKRIQELVYHYDTIGLTLEKAQEFTQSAMESLYLLPASVNRDMLENLAKKLLLRFH